MKTQFVTVFVLAGLFCGCSTPTGESHAGAYTTGDDMMEAEEITLPADYDHDVQHQADHKLRMHVGIKLIKAQAAGNKEPVEINEHLPVRLQTEMANLNRFKIESAYGNVAGDMAVATAAETGEYAVKTPETKNIDLTLNVVMSATKERQRTQDGNEWIFEVECDAHCRDESTHDVKFAEKFKGKAIREQLISMRNKRSAGFDEKMVDAAVQEAAMKALANLFVKLSNKFPVSGNVTGLMPSGETFMFNRGVEQGLVKNQQAVIYVDYDGVDIPVASGTAEPGANKSKLSVRRWNDKNKDAETVIKELKANPKAFFKSYQLYGVSVGLPLPAGWQTFDNK